MIRVPYQNLAARHAPYRAELIRAIETVIDSGEYSDGRFVRRFEQRFASFTQADHALGAASGTDALWLALSALGIGPGDEVVTVPMTFIATCEAISRTGARPVFVDVDPVTYTMDVSALERVCGPRTRALLPVHLFGQTCDMEPIMKFAAARGLYVVEDAAQAHGAEYHRRPAGSIGSAGCFSFYPAKNLGAIGEAGAVITNDPALADQMRIIANHGQRTRGESLQVGWNCRMDGLQGAVLSVMLSGLNRANRRRRRIAAMYDNAFAGIPELAIPVQRENCLHAYHCYVLRVPARDLFLSAMRQQGVDCMVHYPIPVHLQPAYVSLEYGPGSFPVAERCADEFVSLPIYPELTPEQVEAVIDAAVMAARLVTSSAKRNRPTIVQSGRLPSPARQPVV